MFFAVNFFTDADQRVVNFEENISRLQSEVNSIRQEFGEEAVVGPSSECHSAGFFLLFCNFMNSYKIAMKQVIERRENVSHHPNCNVSFGKMMTLLLQAARQERIKARQIQAPSPAAKRGAALVRLASVVPGAVHGNVPSTLPPKSDISGLPTSDAESSPRKRVNVLTRIASVIQDAQGQAHAMLTGHRPSTMKPDAPGTGTIRAQGAALSRIQSVIHDAKVEQGRGAKPGGRPTALDRLGSVVLGKAKLQEVPVPADLFQEYEASQQLSSDEILINFIAKQSVAPSSGECIDPICACLFAYEGRWLLYIASPRRRRR